MRIKRINGGLAVGRTWIGFQRAPGYVPRRFGRRSGGSRTPGPWSEYLVPFVGSVTVSHDGTLFGWEDPANAAPAKRCCGDVAVHSHDGGKTLRKDGQPYTYRYAFEWRRPALKLATAADSQPLRFVLNRYPGVVIGAALYWRHRGLSLLWGRPGRVIETEQAPRTTGSKPSGGDRDA